MQGRAQRALQAGLLHHVAVLVQQVVVAQAILLELPCHGCLIPGGHPAKGLVPGGLRTAQVRVLACDSGSSSSCGRHGAHPKHSHGVRTGCHLLSGLMRGQTPAAECGPYGTHGWERCKHPTYRVCSPRSSGNARCAGAGKLGKAGCGAGQELCCAQHEHEMRHSAGRLSSFVAAPNNVTQHNSSRQLRPRLCRALRTARSGTAPWSCRASSWTCRNAGMRA